MREYLKKLISCALVVAVILAAGHFGMEESITVQATTVGDVKQNIDDLNKEINDLNQSISDMEEQQEILEEQMADLNAEIINTLTSIGMKEDALAEKAAQIEDKQLDIDATSKEYDEAKAKEEERYKDMVVRLRKMYEKGDTNSLNFLLAGDGMGDMLNHMDNVESIYEYDRIKMEQYESAKNEALNLWNQLESEKQDLETAKAGLEEDKAKLETQKAELDGLLATMKQQSSNYDSELKKARQEASVAKAKLQQEQERLRKLQQSGGGGGGNAADGNYDTDYNSIIDEAEGSALGKQVAKYACQYVGNPYVPGGTSLTDGADCSGFTYRVYADFGYSLPRTSTEQRSAGKEVSYSDAQPGDLICYSGHVAIYIGGGKIVHASTQKTGIKVSNNAQYRPILSVRRIV